MRPGRCTGPVAKPAQGRQERRVVVREAAGVAGKSSPFWQARFERLESRMGARKAIVAIARKLLVVRWHVLLGAGC